MESPDIQPPTINALTMQANQAPPTSFPIAKYIIQRTIQRSFQKIYSIVLEKKLPNFVVGNAFEHTHFITRLAFQVMDKGEKTILSNPLNTLSQKVLQDFAISEEAVNVKLRCQRPLIAV